MSVRDKTGESDGPGLVMIAVDHEAHLVDIITTAPISRLLPEAATQVALALATAVQQLQSGPGKPPPASAGAKERGCTCVLPKDRAVTEYVAPSDCPLHKGTVFSRPTTH